MHYCKSLSLIVCIEVVVFFYLIVIKANPLKLLQCPSLTNPNNGMINCSLGDDGLPSYEDTCSFTCNTGYELTGSDTRTCQSDGNWDGSEIICERGT